MTVIGISLTCIAILILIIITYYYGNFYQKSYFCCKQTVNNNDNIHPYPHPQNPNMTTQQVTSIEVKMVPFYQRLFSKFFYYFLFIPNTK